MEDQAERLLLLRQRTVRRCHPQNPIIRSQVMARGHQTQAERASQKELEIEGRGVPGFGPLVSGVKCQKAQEERPEQPDCSPQTILYEV